MENDADLLDRLHRELEERDARICAVALVAAFLVMLALWCWSQQVTP